MAYWICEIKNVSGGRLCRPVAVPSAKLGLDLGYKKKTRAKDGPVVSVANVSDGFFYPRQRVGFQRNPVLRKQNKKSQER